MSERCETCRFWLPPTEGTGLGVGQCRRYPDTVRKTPKQWCGEHQPKDSSDD